MSPRPAARRAVWNLADQVVSSVTNAAMSLLVARSTTGFEFGGFSVAFTVFTLLVGFIRVAATSPLGIRFSGSDPQTFRTAAGDATGTALVVGLVGGAVAVVTGSTLDAPVGPAMIALGVVLPGLLVQEAWRQVFFACGRPAAATLNDIAWAIAQVTVIGAIFALGTPTVVALLLAWGGSGLFAAVLGIRQARVRPRVRRAPSWLSRHRDLTGYMSAEFATLQGTYQVTLLIIAGLGTLESIGALRGAQVLLGPTSIIGVAALSFAIPEFARRRARLDTRRWVLGAVGISIVVAALGLCWGVLFVLGPDVIGATLLGDTWAGTSQILWITILGQLGSAAAIGPSAMLYAMDRARVTMTVHMVFAVLVFGGGVGGVLLGGAVGAASGITVAYWLVLPLWWVRFHREAVRIATSSRSVPDPDLVHQEDTPL